MKKFEEGVFSDLRNLKPGVDACLEEPKVGCSSCLFFLLFCGFCGGVVEWVCVECGVGVCVLSGIIVVTFISCAGYGDVGCGFFCGARLLCDLRISGASGVPRSSRETFLGEWIASFLFLLGSSFFLGIRACLSLPASFGFRSRGCQLVKVG
jgi:hypothetical protein